jgi:hypothetical protein
MSSLLPRDLLLDRLLGDAANLADLLQGQPVPAVVQQFHILPARMDQRIPRGLGIIELLDNDPQSLDLFIVGWRLGFGFLILGHNDLFLCHEPIIHKESELSTFIDVVNLY